MSELLVSNAFYLITISQIRLFFVSAEKVTIYNIFTKEEIMPIDRFVISHFDSTCAQQRTLSLHS